MSRTTWPPRATFAALAFLAACAPARVPLAGEPPSAEAYLAAPRLSELFASKQGDRIAWLSYDRGEHELRPRFDFEHYPFPLYCRMPKRHGDCPACNN